MARYASFGTMLAATALIAWPVMAQTAGSTSAPPPSPPGMTPSHSANPGMATSTPSHPANPGMATSSPASAPAAPIYFTADHQVRASKVVGASIYNDQNQSIGSIDDLLMSDNDHKAGTAVLSVGGFLGMGAKLVSVPFDQLRIQDDKIVMPGATKASLEAMPEYRYKSA
jgi:sporulation protein YlmC with PRC-barrel domain